MSQETKQDSPRWKDRVAAAALIATFLVLVLGYLWWGRFEYAKGLLLGIAYGGTGVILFVNHLLFRDSLKKMGLRVDNLSAALRISLIPNLVLAATIVIWGLLASRSEPDWSIQFLLYVPWALLQQFILQNLLLARFRTVFHHTGIAWLAASVAFALVHLPHPAMVLTTFFGAVVWCWIFLKAPNLLVVSMSHAALGILLVCFLKFSSLGRLYVGKPGYAYGAFGDGVLVASGYDGQGEPFIATLPGPNHGSPSRVRVFRPEGKLLFEWTAFPDLDFSGNLAVGDLGFSAGDEIAVAPGPIGRNPAEVRIFDLGGGQLGRFRLERASGYGAAVAISEGHILVTPGPGPERPACIFEYRPDGTLLRELDLGEIGFHNSVWAQRVTVEDHGRPDQDSKLLLWANPLSVNPSTIRVYDERLGELTTWRTYGSSFGLNLSLIRLASGKVGVVTGPGSAPGHTPRVMILDSEGRQLDDFFAYEDDSPCGTHVSAVDVDGDAIDEIVLGEGSCPGQPPIVRILDLDHRLLFQWDAY